MRIAVLADTHDRLPPHLPPLLATADEIWHLGDVCSPSIIETLCRVGRPLRVVRGNCDSCDDWPLAIDCEIEGFCIRLTHIPPPFAPKGVDLLLHGHTHVPRFEQVAHATFLNPGCITRPKRGAPASWAWLELRRGASVGWTYETVAPS
jgi:putative phosphoesterase